MDQKTHDDGFIVDVLARCVFGSQKKNAEIRNTSQGFVSRLGYSITNIEKRPWLEAHIEAIIKALAS